MVYLCPDLVHRYWWQEGQLRREWDLFTHVTTTKVSVTPRLRFIPLSKYTRSSSARQEKSYLANACARLQKYNILYHTIGYINIIIYYIIIYYIFIAYIFFYYNILCFRMISFASAVISIHKMDHQHVWLSQLRDLETESASQNHYKQR